MDIATYSIPSSNDIYYFLFHPLGSEDAARNIAAVITNIFLTVITFGLWQIPFLIFNTLDNRKIVIEEDKVTTPVPSSIPTGAISGSLSSGSVPLNSTSGGAGGSGATSLPLNGSTSSILSDVGVDNAEEILERAKKMKLLKEAAESTSFFVNYNDFLKRVKEEMGDDPSVIETHLKARDTLIVWQSLYAPSKKLQCSTLEDVIANAAGFGDWFKSANKERKEMDLAHKDLTYLPEQLGEIDNLTKLWLESNRFSSFPSTITKMKNLTELHLQDNQITSIPDEIGKCTNLKLLALENNKLSCLTSQIGNLENLETLWLDNNQLSELPATIGNCAHLRVLSIDNNKISSLPQEITNLKYLRKNWEDRIV